MNTIEISNIRKIRYNGVNVKVFDVREGGVFAGTFTAPVRTADRDLAAVAIEKMAD